jgi:hypothetical protein
MDVAIFHDIFSSWHYAFYYSPTKKQRLVYHMSNYLSTHNLLLVHYYLMDQMTLQYPTTLKDIIPVCLIESLIS